MIPLIGLIIAALIGTVVLTEANLSQNSSLSNPQNQSSVSNTVSVTYSDATSGNFAIQSNTVDVLLNQIISNPAPNPSPSPSPTPASTPSPAPTPSPSPSPTPSPEEHSPNPPPPSEPLERSGDVATPEHFHLVSGVLKNTIYLEWQSSDPKVNGFRIYRNNLSIATVDTPDQHFQDDLDSLGQYNYTIRAYDTDGNYSNSVGPVSVIADLSLNVLSFAAPAFDESR